MTVPEISIYGSHLEEMESVMKSLLFRIRKGVEEIKKIAGMEPVEHLKYRIKTDESMREKCRRFGFPETENSALNFFHDAIGLRVVCSFLDDVYSIRDYIASQEEIEVVQEKDYIRNVKPNGYRSLHMIVRMNSSYVILMRMRLLYASIAVGALSVLAALFPVIRLSAKMILPEIENSRRQQQFLTNVSHELKTPLAVIRSNAEIEELKKGESEWMKSTIRQVDRMSGLIKNLVMITKTREMEESSSADAVNISDIVSQTAKEYSAMAEVERKTLLQKIEADIEQRVGESGLRQLIVILLDNAVKYCDAGGEILVSLERLKRGKNKVQLIVSNTYTEGEHIDCTRFFDRFFREDASHNIDTGGYGIGLSIAQSLCGQLGGGISVQWQDGVISFICEIC